jgi:hypothetical protein
VRLIAGMPGSENLLDRSNGRVTAQLFSNGVRRTTSQEPLGGGLRDATNEKARSALKVSQYVS